MRGAPKALFDSVLEIWRNFKVPLKHGMKGRAITETIHIAFGWSQFHNVPEPM